MSGNLGRRLGVCLLTLAGMIAVARPGWAGTPTVIWQANGIRTGYPNAVFSADGTGVLLATATGFELRRAADGVLVHTVSLPAASQTYDAMAFSPDQTLIALSLFTNAAPTIELWQVSSGTRVRTLTTDAVRNIKGLAFSSTGLLASRERFAYGGGGFLWVFRVSDGTLVKKLGPVARNSAPGGVAFSPNGQYLAVNDTFSLQGISILRTSDWGSARTISSAGVFGWSSDSASLWTDGFQRIRISDGAVLQTAPVPASSDVTAITADNRFLFAWDMVNGSASNTVRFLRAADGGTQLVYTFASGSVVWSNQVNALDTVFSYEMCPSACTVYFAKMPAL
jgi:hypothetical protein